VTIALTALIACSSSNDKTSSSSSGSVPAGCRFDADCAGLKCNVSTGQCVPFAAPPPAPKPIGTCAELNRQNGTVASDECGDPSLTCLVYDSSDAPPVRCFASFWINPDGSYNNELNKKYCAACVPK
jgi:hypothetical protein